MLGSYPGCLLSHLSASNRLPVLYKSTARPHVLRWRGQTWDSNPADNRYEGLSCPARLAKLNGWLNFAPFPLSRLYRSFLGVEPSPPGLRPGVLPLH